MIAVSGGWRATLASYRHPEVRKLLFLGYASGLPFMLVLITLGLWLRESGFTLKSIGHFSWVGLAYSLKFFWSPMVDRLRLPLLHRLGRRRSWMLLAQVCIVIGLVLQAENDPAADPVRTVWIAIFTAFFAATQDIAIDAYRIESGSLDLQASMAAAYQIGYQLALISAGAGALYIASAAGFPVAYLCMAALMVGIGIVSTLVVSEPEPRIDRATIADEQRVIHFLAGSAHWPEPLRNSTAWLIGAVVSPFVDFFRRNGLISAALIMALICSYRLNYTAMGVMANPFYLHLGFSLTQIATVVKVYGVCMTLFGATLAGAIVARFGFFPALWAGALIVTAGNLTYAAMAGTHQDIRWLTVAISIDNLGNGMAGTAFIAYLSSLTNVAYSATQYALFGTLWSLPAKGISGLSGDIADAIGFRSFFLYTAVLTLPALLLLIAVARRTARHSARHTARHTAVPPAG